MQLAQDTPKHQGLKKGRQLQVIFNLHIFSGLGHVFSMCDSIFFFFKKLPICYAYLRIPMYNMSGGMLLLRVFVGNIFSLCCDVSHCSNKSPGYSQMVQRQEWIWFYQ